MSDPLFDPDRNPAADLILAIQQACRERKNILLEIGGDWCIWCQRLETFITDHSELRELRERHYCLVRIFVDPEVELPPLFSYLPPFDGVPHFYVFSPSGELLHTQDTAPLEAGESYNLERVAAFLQRWAGVHGPPLRHSRATALDHYITALFDKLTRGPLTSA